MRVLILGGSVFAGRAAVGQAQAAGHEVTVFNRGRSAPTPTGAEQITGDRTRDLTPLRGRRFDLVIDTSGYVPVDVGRSALEVDAAAYVFVSTISVYPDWPERADYAAVWDGDPDAAHAPAELDPAAAYGWLKAGCERALLRARPEATILRAGSIVGPWDSQVGRLPWWLWRVSRGGPTLVPGEPPDAMSLLDARDLADFALRGVPGTYDLGGPSGRDTRGGLMSACRVATRSDAELVWVGEWLADHDVEPWTEIPLWAPDAPGLFAADVTAAAAAGMRWRPLDETVADTWAWLPDDWRPTARTPGLAPHKERDLLVAWRAATRR